MELSKLSPKFPDTNGPSKNPCTRVAFGLRHLGIMPMFIRILIVLLMLGGVFGGIFALKQHQAQQAAAIAATPPPPAVVVSTQVVTESWQPYLQAVGSLVASQGVYVTNEIEGQVNNITFESGQRTAQGAPLIELDSSVDRATLQGLIAGRRLADIEFERAEKLVKQKTLSEADFDQSEAKLSQADSQVAAQRALVKKKDIRAPFDGLLGIRLVDIGQYLAAGSRIVLLQTLDPIFADYSLPERHFDALAPGQAITVQVQAYPDEVFQGRISALDPGIDPGTRSIRVRATIANPDGRLRPGMFAEVRTLLPERTEVLTLPRTAISYNPYGDFVFVIEEQDGRFTAQRRQVTTGSAREGRVEIIEGLRAGETVVGAGQVKLRSGQPVSIDNSISTEPAS